MDNSIIVVIINEVLFVSLVVYIVLKFWEYATQRTKLILYYRVFAMLAVEFLIINFVLYPISQMVNNGVIDVILALANLVIAGFVLVKIHRLTSKSVSDYIEKREIEVKELFRKSIKR
jgi:hypothetical protein